MSRHHMLPPIVYVPQPKPKKIENRKSRLQMRMAGSIDDSGDVEETYQPVGAARTMQAGNTPTPENFAPIEGSERKPQPTTGLLSESTLTVLLQAQELR
jgi:hypothetical protein